MKPLINEDGITVTELKEWLEQFSQCFDWDGEENRVWILHDEKGHSCGLSSPITEACRLSKADVIFSRREE